MIKVKIRILPDERKTKPTTPEEKRKWSIEMANANDEEVTIEELAGIIGDMGCSFNHATYANNWINRANFESSQLLVIDIDGRISPYELMERCEMYGLRPPNIIYRTLSDQTDDKLTNNEKLKVAKKFRAIFVLDSEICEIDAYEVILKEGIYKLFPEADNVSSVQKWLGGQEVIYLDTESQLRPVYLLNAAEAFDVRNIHKPQNKSSRFKKMKILPSRIPKESAGTADVGLKMAYAYNKSLASVKKDLIRNFDWEGAQVEFTFLSEFFNASRKFSHFELRGLYAALKKIKGGKLKWRESVRKNPLIDDVKIVEIAKWMDDYEKKGQIYREEYIAVYMTGVKLNQYHRLTDFHYKKGQHAELMTPVETRTLVEAEKKLVEVIELAMNDNSEGKWVIKASPGLGKTDVTIRAIRRGCVYAVPTHALKNEVAIRFLSLGIEVNVVPDEPKLPLPIYDEYMRFMKVGAFSSASMFLRRLSQKHVGIHYGITGQESIALKRSLERYFAELDKCLNSDLPIICTHKRMLFSEFPKHDTFVIDEDIIPLLFEMKSVNTKDIRLLVYNISCATYEGVEKDISILTNILNMVNSCDLTGNPQTNDFPKPEEFSNFNEVKRAACNSTPSIKGEIISLFSADSYTVELLDSEDVAGERIIHFLIQRSLPVGKKMIILSATANKFLYEQVIGDMQWNDLSHIEHAGTRVQFSDLSHSRSTIASSNNKKALDRIIRFLGETSVITFKKYQRLFKHAVQISLENCSGFDDLRGQDIAVIGTPHLPVVVYKMMAYALGIEFVSEDLEMKERIVTHNGYRFKIMTFEHLGLQNIQFYFIESALIQACGRSRTIREKATVYLFANYPLPGFEQRNSHELPEAGYIELEVEEEDEQ